MYLPPSFLSSWLYISVFFFFFSRFTSVSPHTVYDQSCSKLTCSLHWVTVFPWPLCTAEAAVLRVRHLWSCPHPGNALRFITYWYTPSLNTPPKTPTVHCWLMSCTVSSPWIIFLKRIFPPFVHSPFLWFHILCQIDKVLCVQPNKETVFFPALVCFSRWERKGMKWWWMFFCQCLYACPS